MIKHDLTQLIKDHAKVLGFSGIGIIKAERLSPEDEHLESWLNGGNQGTMSYLENHFEKRVDPSKLVPGAQSVISLMYNYYTDQHQTDPKAPKISKYAYGKDYHKIIKKKLAALYAFMQDTLGDIHGRCFVDSAPLLERDIAKRAGLGWIGKNTLLIHPKKGSFYFLSEIVVDVELEYDVPIEDYCGTCSRCIDACPTEAISPTGYVLDSNKCISYLTIERKEEIPEIFSEKMDNWVFGCDICQDVCPWNRFAHNHQEKEFEPSTNFLHMTKTAWLDITEEIFNELFRGSAIKRTKYKGLDRNLKFLHPDYR